MKAIILFFTSLFFLSSCTKTHENENPYEVEITKIAVEQQIPKGLMVELDNQLKEEFKNSPPLYSFIPIEVLFNEYSSNVLKKPQMIFKFPKGGGELDLSEVVDGEGSFYMSFPSEQFDKNNELLGLYFISNSPKQKIENEQFGLGCGKWNNIKDNFSKIQKNNFLKLNTSELRYLHVIAGTFVFVFKQGKNIMVSQVTLTDSRHTKSLCVGAI